MKTNFKNKLKFGFTQIFITTLFLILKKQKETKYPTTENYKKRGKKCQLNYFL